MSAVIFIAYGELGKHEGLGKQLKPFALRVKRAEGGHLFLVRTGCMASFVSILHPYRVCFGVHLINRAALGKQRSGGPASRDGKLRQIQVQVKSKDQQQHP